MADVVFTEQEQLKLRELNNSGSQFDAFKNLILRSIHLGQDAQLVVSAVSFFDQMVQQVSAQIKSIESAASERAEAAKSAKE